MSLQLCLIIAWLLLFATVSVSQISTSIALKQPNDLEYTVTSNCCTYRHNNHGDTAYELVDCIVKATRTYNDQFISKTASSSSPIYSIYTYYTDDIVVSYASSSIASLSAYAEQNRYLFYPLSGRQSNFAPYDPRWNKICILIEGLKKHQKLHTFYSGDGSGYSVWVDADLIVLDLSLQLHEVTRAYPSADIILSKDSATAPHVCNTGFIIVKHSLWSLNFLNAWWLRYDKKMYCDQHVFTWLYYEMDEIDRDSHISLLPADYINSDFPSWISQKDFNQVLHLAGLTSLARKPVFDYAFDELCRAINVDFDGELQMGNTCSTLKPQLGITREYLSSVINVLPLRRLRALKTLNDSLSRADVMLDSLLHEDDCCGAASLTMLEAAISEVGSRLDDITKRDDNEISQYDSDGSSVGEYITANTINIKKWILSSYSKYISCITYSSLHTVSTLSMIELIRETISKAYELVVFMGESSTSAIARNSEHSDESTSLLSQQEMVLLEVQNSLLPSMKHLIEVATTQAISVGAASIESIRLLKCKALYYEFKQKQLLSIIYERRDDIEAMINSLLDASSLWANMTDNNYFGSEYFLTEPYKEGSEILSKLGVLLCYNKSYKNGVLYLKQAVQWREKSIAEFKIHRVATKQVVTDGYTALVDDLYNIGLCISNSMNGTEHSIDGDGLLYFGRAKDILDDIKLTDTDMYKSLVDYTANCSSSSSSSAGSSRKPSDGKRRKLLMRKKRESYQQE